nr:ATP-binding protein [uncultured Chitinophaga sp.]
MDESKYKDSLEAVLTGHLTDDMKARAAFRLSDYWARKDTVRSGQFLTRAFKLSGNDTLLKAISYYYLGSYHHKYHKALAKSMYIRADSLLNSIHQQEAYTFRFWSWYAYSRLVNEEDNDKERMNIILNKALPVAWRSGDSGLVGLSYGTMAIIFNNSVRLEKAEDYFLKSIDLLKKSPYKGILVDIYARSARNYMAYVSRVTEDTAEMRAVRNKLPLVKAVLDSARNLIGSYVHSPAAIEYYKYRGKYFRLLKQYKKSHHNIDSGMAIAKAHQLPYDIELFNLHKYLVYSDQHQFAKAKALILRLVNDSTTIFYRDNRQVYYYELSLTYARLGDFKNAYEWKLKTDQLGDDLAATREREAIDAMEVKYLTAEGEKKIILLEAEKKQAILSGRNNRLVNWLLAIGCFLLLSIAVYSIALYRKNKKISEQQLKTVEQQQALKLSQTLLESQEAERTRIARELHDGLGSMLASVKINLSDMPPDHRLNDSILQLDRSVGELRRIAHNLMPATLLRYGLETSLKELCESLMSKQLTIDLQCIDIQRDLPQKEQLFIYRIVQELLSNAIKHANAKNIMLQCSQDHTIFLITIEDDGIGFDIEQADLSKGIGIANIQSRVAYLNGTIEFMKKEPRSGSTINIELYVTA